MKRFLSLITALLLTFCFISSVGVFAATSPLGDVNGDGNLDIVDVALTRGHIVGNISF